MTSEIAVAEVPVEAGNNVFEAFAADPNTYKPLLPTADTIKRQKNNYEKEIAASIKKHEERKPKKLRWDEYDGNSPNALARTVVLTNISTASTRAAIRSLVLAALKKSATLNKTLADEEINKEQITIENCIEAIYFRSIDLRHKGDDDLLETGNEEESENENKEEEEEQKQSEKEAEDKKDKKENSNNNESSEENENSDNNNNLKDFEAMVASKKDISIRSIKKIALKDKNMVSLNPNATMHAFIRFAPINDQEKKMETSLKAEFEKNIKLALFESRKDDSVNPKQIVYSYSKKLKMSQFVAALLRKSGLMLLNGKHIFAYSATTEHPEIDTKRALFIGNLPTRLINIEAIFAFFERKYGLHASQFRMPRNPDTQNTKGFAIIEFIEQPPQDIFEKTFHIVPSKELELFAKFKASKKSKNDKEDEEIILSNQNPLGQSLEKTQREKDSEFTIRIKKCVSEKKAMKRKIQHEQIKKINDRRDRKKMVGKQKPKMLEALDKRRINEKAGSDITEARPKSVVANTKFGKPALRFVGRKLQ